MTLANFDDLTQDQRKEIINQISEILKQRIELATSKQEHLDIIRNLSIDGFAEYGDGIVEVCVNGFWNFDNDTVDDFIKQFGYIDDIDNSAYELAFKWIPFNCMKSCSNVMESIKNLSRICNQLNQVILISQCEPVYSRTVGSFISVSDIPSMLEYKILDFADCRESLGNATFLEDCLQKEVAIASQPNPRKQPEKQKELDLYSWMRRNKFEVERQVSTSQKHRIDLWIPGKLMIELKQGKVIGDDVCQAIDYYSVYRKPIVLVGTGLSAAASRGIEAFVRLHGEDSLQFVTYGAIKSYLKGLVND